MKRSFYTIQEVANLLRISRRSVYRLFQKGLRFKKIGGAVRVHKDDLFEFIDKKIEEELDKNKA